MANKQHAQFSDENGNIFYLENETEDVLDPSGKPLSNGGDLSEASVTFTPDEIRKLPQSGGRFKAFLGSIVKFLSDLTEVAFTGKYSDLEGKPTIPPLANNCTTTAAGYGLDARQGKVLMDKANQLSSEIKAVNVYVGSDGKLHFTNSGGADSVLPFSSINAVEDISSKLTAYASQNHGFRSTESLAGYKYVIVCATYQGGKSANFTTFSGCSCMIQTGWDAGGWTNEGIGVHSNHLCILSNITGVIDVYASSTGTGYTSVRAFALS